MITAARLAGVPLYCDTGPHAGNTRIDLSITLYLTAEETIAWAGPGSLRLTLPGCPAPGQPATLTGLPARIRENPLFRQGYEQGYHRGYSDRAGEETRPASPGPVPTGPGRVYDVTAGPLGAQLEPGVRAERDLTRLTGSRAVTRVPCCGRPVTLPAPAGQQDEPAAVCCCRCGLLFGAEVIPAPDDGFGTGPSHLAVFTVTGNHLAAAGHRPPATSTRGEPRR